MKKITILMIAALMTFSGVIHAEKSQSNSTQEIVELTPSDFKPAFTRDTVIKLNGIVSRSLDVINEYDEIISGIVASVDQETEQKSSEAGKKALFNGVSKITELSKRAKVILSDMQVAEKQLKESGEHYNRAIFAGMMDFVQDVEKEVSSQSDSLRKKLNKA